MLGVKEGSVISEFMCHLDLTGTLNNPPFAKRIPSTLGYLREYGLDRAYVTSCAPGETRQKFKRIVYEVLLRPTNNASRPGELRIVNKFTGVDWERVWKTYTPAGSLTTNHEGMPRYKTSFHK